MAAGSAPELVASASDLREATERVGAQISADHPDGVRLIAVLRASTIFVADLIRFITVPATVDFVALAPFDGQRARTRLVKDLERSVSEERVVLVTAIVDTGLSTDFLRRRIEASDPRSLKVATMADKQARRIVPMAPDYAALSPPDRYLLGCGLGYRGRYRNLSSLWAVDAADLIDDPEAHVETLYGAPTGL